MSFWIIVANRLEKILGTVVKTLAYPFHTLFPKKRFTIPAHATPLCTSKHKSVIPKIIWQTNYTNHVSLPVYANYLFNRLMGYDFEYRYVSTEERLAFIKQHAPKRLISAFEQLTDGAAQADFWRIFVLNHTGGVYMDIDAHAVWPLSKIIKEHDKELILMTKHRYSNYFIATAPNNPHLAKTLEIIVENIEQKNIGGGVYDLTGPTALNRAIGESVVNHRHNRITCIQGSFTNEHFQYIDKPRGKWTYKKQEELLKPKGGQ